jgi:hypothetical protein
MFVTVFLASNVKNKYHDFKRGEEIQGGSPACAPRYPRPDEEAAVEARGGSLHRVRKII